MNILLEDSNVIMNVYTVKSIEDIKACSELYYELGYYRHLDSLSGWVRTNRFKKIDDIKEMLRLDKNLNDSDYLAHHNFVCK